MTDGDPLTDGNFPLPRGCLKEIKRKITACARRRKLIGIRRAPYIAPKKK